MNELRFKLKVPQAGSAARTAEQRATVLSRPQVSAGDSARLAEDEKRACKTFTNGAAGFSLRAQGGKVLRKNLGPEADITRDTEFFDWTAAEKSGVTNVGDEMVSSPSELHKSNHAGLNGRLTSVAQNLRRLFRA